jgi:transposase-like protein
MAYEKLMYRMLLEVGDKETRERIARVYKDVHCNHLKTARRLGVSPGTLYRWRHQYKALDTILLEAKRDWAKEALKGIS